MAAERWGDDYDDSDEENVNVATKTTGDAALEIPPTHKSRIDSKGIQIVTSYRQHPANSKALLKTITKVKVFTETIKESKAVGIRRKWSKFGDALKDELADGGGHRSCIQSKDDIFLEDPNADTDLQDEDPTKAIAGNLNEFWAKQQRRQLERKYDVGGEEGTGEGGGAGDGWTQVGAAGAGAGAPGKYVPPSARGGVGGGGGPGGGGLAGLAAKAGATQQRTDDLNTIRVTNVSENTTEADLQELFKPFGRISRVYLAKDKETLQSRGFAFVSFVDQKDAARAMDKLQGYGYDHLILKLEWARPNAPKDPATSGNEYRSGYGKALAQDTKAKVSYASNLTN